MTEDLAHQTTTSPTTTRQGNGFAVAGLVCGLVGLAFINYILGPLAIVFGGIGWARANRGARYRGMAIAAVVLGVLDLVVFGVVVAVVARHGGFSYVHVG